MIRRRYRLGPGPVLAASRPRRHPPAMRSVRRLDPKGHPMIHLPRSPLDGDSMWVAASHVVAISGRSVLLSTGDTIVTDATEAELLQRYLVAISGVADDDPDYLDVTAALGSDSPPHVIVIGSHLV